MKRRGKYPTGWNEPRVRKVLDHYEQQSDKAATIEDDAALKKLTSTVMVVPIDLVPKIRELIAKHMGTE